MNEHPNPAQFTKPEKRLEVDTLAAERTLLGRCFVRPDTLSEISDRLSEKDFGHAINGKIFATMVRIASENRTPSAAAINAARGASEEIEPGVTWGDYVFDLANDALHALPLPTEDALGVILDAVQREKASTLGHTLANRAAAPGASLRDALQETVDAADDILAAYRSSISRTLDMGQTADRALAHMLGDSPNYPTTGLADFDRMIGGWPRGQLSIVAGRPGMGKSAAALAALRMGAQAGHASLFFSLEMTAEQMGARLLTDIAFINSDPIFYEAILNRRVTEDRHLRRLREAQDKLRELPVIVEEKKNPTLSEITARCRKAANTFDKQGRKLETIFVDHILLIKPSGRYAGRRNDEVREYAEGLMTLASELDVSLVGLCQLNRAVEKQENKRPSLADLKESGAIEEAASLVTFLFRPEYYLQKKDDDPEEDRKRLDLLDACRNVIEYDVAKNRNGRVGSFEVWANIGANAIRNKSFGAT